MIIDPLPPGMTPDVRVDSHHGLYVLTPLSAEAADWCRSYINPDAARTGNGYLVEGRYAEDIMDGMDASGLCFEAGVGFRFGPVDDD